MTDIDCSPKTLTQLDVTISPEELGEKIQAGKNKQQFVDKAVVLLDKLDRCWNPAIVYRWLPVSMNESNETNCTVEIDSDKLSFRLGHSSTFIKNARYALAACYTAGDAIEKKAQEASEKQQFLDSYLLDIINLLVLEKTGNIITGIAEQSAKERSWGVSPFLSPGSVHGWELEEQHKIAQLLPLSQIGVAIRPDAVLIPFKSLTCLIGIGKGYSATSVGTTCQVCSKNSTCQMRYK